MGVVGVGMAVTYIAIRYVDKPRAVIGAAIVHVMVE